MIGASKGPNTVIYSLSVMFQHSQTFWVLTTMNHAKARPRVTGSLYISASWPATIAIGELATEPVQNLNTSRADQFGDNAQPKVNAMNKPKVASDNFFLPKCSLNGPPFLAVSGLERSWGEVSAQVCRV